jgi:ABC-type branched-subunit amino acid transport system permease subunit
MARRVGNGISAGITFGIVTVFLVLIGFTGTISDILGALFNNKHGGPLVGLTPAMVDLLVFLTLIGLWAGALGGKKAASERRSRGPVLFSAGVAGAVVGLIVGGFALLVGSLSQSGVRLVVYFAQLLPDAVRLFLMGMAPLPAAGFYLAFFTVFGALGGLIRSWLMQGTARKQLAGSFTAVSRSVRESGLLKLIKRSTAARLVAYALLAAVVFLIPLALGEYWNYTLGTIGIYVLLGLGLNIVVGLAGLLDLGYVAFFAIGGYTVALLTAPGHHLLWSFWTAIPIGVVLAAMAGVILGVPVLRLRGDYLAIVTLGFGQIIAVMLRSDELTGFTGGPKGVTAVAGPVIFGHVFDSALAFVYLILLAVILVVVVTVRLRNSRIGRAWEAMREDESVARAMGINTLSYKLLAFAVGAAFAGLGGVLFAARNQFTGPEDYSLMVSFNVLASVIVGGMGSLSGVVAGAFALKGLPEVLRELENYRVLAFGALLIVMMLIRPEGLIPTARRKMELKHEKVRESSGDQSGGKPDG